MTDNSICGAPEWEDDQKMAFLFAPFRDRSVNPLSWDRKLEFWIHLIEENCRNNNLIIIDPKHLSSRFKRKSRQPVCLDIVVSEMRRSGKLKKISTYSNANSWMQWGVKTFVQTPLLWGWSAIRGTQNNATEALVLHEILKERCERLLCDHYSSVKHDTTDNVVELATLKAQHSDLCASEDDFDIVMQQLCIDKKLQIITTDEKETVVKFCQEGDKYVKSISQVELNTLRILKAEKNLEKQTDVLSRQCQQYTENARSLVREGKRTHALQALRKKKRVEEILQKKMASLDMLHNIITKIQDAATNEMILKGYESGLNAMTSLNQEASVDKVENVMDNIQDALEYQGDVSVMLGQDLNDTCQDDLEAELSDLLMADKRSMDDNTNMIAGLLDSLHVSDKISELPDPPKHSPSRSPRGDEHLFTTPS